MPTRIELIGVVAMGNATRERAAVLSVDGKPPEAVRIGKEFLPGFTLQAIEHKAIVINKGNSEERIPILSDKTLMQGAGHFPTNPSTRNGNSPQNLEAPYPNTSAMWEPNEPSSSKQNSYQNNSQQAPPSLPPGMWEPNASTNTPPNMYLPNNGNTPPPAEQK